VRLGVGDPDSVAVTLVRHAALPAHGLGDLLEGRLFVVADLLYGVGAAAAVAASVAVCMVVTWPLS